MNKIYFFTVFAICSFFSMTIRAQKDSIIQVSEFGLLTPKASINLFNSLSKKDTDIIKAFKLTDTNDIKFQSPAMYRYFNKMKEYLEDKPKNSAVIFVYRNMSIDNSKYKADFKSSNYIIYHNGTKIDNKMAEYLLNTKDIYVIMVDLNDKYYEDNHNDSFQLTNSILKITYDTSYFLKSLEGIIKIYGALGHQGGEKEIKDAEQINDQLKIVLIKMRHKKVKAPCAIAITNKYFKKDMNFTVHEKNWASFQAGLVNNQFSESNFSISNGNLVVTPDSTQKKTWKSNFYALIEVHIPRDVDNFRPVWKAFFSKDPYSRGPLHWVYGWTLERIGIYGGVKISGDPLSNLYGGFNYAITKDIYINYGWVWNNEVTPQVKTIGNITSASDVLSYMKRSYSSPTQSVGLSFAPSAVIKMMGIK
jgi:hypothetical protein